jgi:hypothetical protein
MMSASDLALTAGDSPDLPTTGGAYAKLLAALSRELDTSSDNYLPNAHAGDFAIFTSDGTIVVPGATGFIGQTLAFERPWIEYLEGEEPIRHLKKPPGVIFVYRGERGAEQPGTYQIKADGTVGNRVTETLIAYLLIKEPKIDEVVSLNFTKTALRKSGNNFQNTAQQLAVRIGPDGLQWVTGCTLGKFRITSRIAEDDNRRWHVPKVVLLGKLGEEGGPTIEEWRTAQGLRMAAKAPAPVPLASAPALVSSEIEHPNPDLVPEHHLDDDSVEEIID